MNSKEMTSPELILASSSAYRKKLLECLRLEFSCISPGCDESLQPGEDVHQATSRLAQDKAQQVLQQHPQACVIGSDQLCCLNQTSLIGKPGSIAAAAQQLKRLSGQSVEFVTAVCVLSRTSRQQRVVTSTVQFRQLSDTEIQRYLELEPEAIYCAGSFMSEALGISLCQSIHSDDPTALIGLPLIATADMLRQQGLQLP